MEAAKAAESLSILNPAPQRLPGPNLLHQLIRSQINDVTPALDFVDALGRRQVLSYAALHERSDALAVHISIEISVISSASSNNTSEQLVIPFMIPQSPELYIAILAILKSGAAYCPLNLDTPPDRLKFILGDVNARLILANKDTKAKIVGSDGALNVVCVDEAARLGKPKRETTAALPPTNPIESDLAYIMYTSGSTGTPKGVGVSHLAATQSLLAHDRFIPRFSRFLQFAAPTFDVSVFEIFFPLFRGSTLVGCEKAHMLADLPAVLRDMEVDACELTPSVAGSLLKSRSNAPGLKLVLTIGEMLTQPVVAEFGGGGFDESILWGMYGPTEAAIHCTLQPSFQRDTSPKCIGFPLDTVSAFVIRNSVEGTSPQAFEVLPMGEIGELAVGGYQLAAGYLNRPEQTASAFVNTEYGRVYKTGDKARMLPDGTIECLGRVAEGQIKLNGQRMELGEVEHALLQSPGCHSAYVCVISNNLIAFAAVDVADGMEQVLKAACQKWLPAFMIPSEIVVMTSFPRLPSGKIDRMRLKEDYTRTNSSELFDEQPYQDDLERTLCEIASEILETRISPSSRLGSSGLDSLAAIQFVARLRTQTYFISPIDILDAATVSDLYKILRNRDPNQKHHYVLPNDRAKSDGSNLMDMLRHDPAYQNSTNEVEAVTNCSPLQISMIAETLKDARLYVNTIQIRLPPDATLPAISAWLHEVARKNQILRSGFIIINGALMQVIWKHLLDTQISEVISFSKNKQEDVEKFLERPFRIEILRNQAAATFILHHAIYDGWSMDLLVQDLVTLSHGAIPPDRPQFHAVAQTLEAPLIDYEIASANEFWAEHLQGFSGSSMPNFATIAVAESEIESLCLETNLSPKTLRESAASWGVSTQSLFQGCLAWLWGAVTGSEDVTIGSAFSGRTLPLPEIEHVMGPLISTFPLRIKLTELNTMRDLIQDCHSISRQIMRLKPMQLVDVKKAAGLPSSCKLFDVMFAYQESMISRERGAEAIEQVSHKDALETKLLLEVEPRATTFICQWTWHTDAFSASQVKSLAEHFCHLIEFLTQHVDERLAAIRRSFPTASLSTYTSGLRQVEICSSLATIVHQTASQYPESEALCFADSIDPSHIKTQSLTYKELDHSANQVARHLIASGVTPGGVVAIILEKSPMLYCGILGILKAGCAYLPILPSTPVKRIALIVEQARPQLCIVDKVSHWHDLSLLTDIVDLEDSKMRRFDDSNVAITTESSQLAYVIFTSGTTGTPKGVSVTNANMLSNIEVLARIYPHRPGDRMLQACSQAFDVSVFEIFFAWANGMCLCAATNDSLFGDLEQSIRGLSVTHLSMTVTVASLVHPENVPSVKFLVTSGEAMTNEVLRRWAHCLYQGYGPSETTNICTVRKVSKGDSSQYLGWSFENTSSFVFAPDCDELVPIGCLGEFCFGGDQIAAGYLNMPDLTATKFFQHSQYGRLYRSGDLGRMLPDGSLIISGRLDSQVKLRGQRVELNEIISLALKSGIASAGACVLLSRRDTESQQLALCYVSASENISTFNFLPITRTKRAEHETMQQTLQSSLPGYMVPSFIIPISSLPLTSSGKTNVEYLRQSIAAFPESDLSRYSVSANSDTDMGGEWTATELHIRDSLRASLNIDSANIGRWTSFAALGVDSISAMPLSRRLQSSLSRRVPLSMILQNSNISRLAIALENSLNPVSSHEQRNLMPSAVVQSIEKQFTDRHLPVEDVLPCTPLQEAMLAASLSFQENATYCNQMVFRLTISSSELRKYWDQLCLRHGILRTCFTTTEDKDVPFAQVILQSSTPDWVQVEADDWESHVLHHLATIPEAVDSYVPPLAFSIIDAGDHGTYFSFVCHHALYDGVAVRTLLSQFEGLAHGAKLPPSPSFKPFLREALALPLDADSFWTNWLESIRPVSLPRSDPHYANETNGAPSLNSSRMISSLSSTEARLRGLGIPLLSLCQAAWSETLSVVSKTTDICFGNVLNGRSIALDDIDYLVAPCFNTIPMRVKFDNLVTNRDLMKRCQHLNASSLPYQFTPLRKIQSLLKLNHTRMFDTLLLLQSAAEPLDGDLWSLKWDKGTMDVPLVCEIIPDNINDRLDVHFHRDSTVSVDTAGLLQAVFIQITEICLKYPSSQIDPTKKLSQYLQDRLGKITPHDIRADVALEAMSASTGTWTEQEEQVLQIVAKLSGRSRTKIEKNTSIHRLGLDSINAVQIANLLRQEGLHVSPAAILANPTCAGISAHCRGTEPSTHDEQPVFDFVSFQEYTEAQIPTSKLPYRREAILPCTPLQQGMISQFILSEGKNYFNSMSWQLHPDVDCHQLANAWKAVVAKHQILRTGFTPVKHPAVSFAMVIYDRSMAAPVHVLSGDSVDGFNPQKAHLDCAQRSLETVICPPWQAMILNGPSSRFMHLSMHHALYDAFSLQQMIYELFLAIGGRMTDTPISIKDPVGAVLTQIASQEKKAETFWRAKSSLAIINPFPVLTPLRVETDEVLSLSSTSTESCKALKDGAANAGVTLQAALQSAWIRLLSAYHGEPAVTFGVVFSGRNDDKLDGPLFPRIITLPVFGSDSDSNREILTSMMEFNVALRQVESIPLSKVQKWVGQQDTALFDSILVYQQQSNKINDALPWSVSGENAAVDYSVSFEIEESADGKFVYNLVYRRDILPQEQAALILRQFDAILCHILASPDGRRDDIVNASSSIFSISPPENRELPSEISLLHQFVERTAALNPEKPALEFVDELSSKITSRMWSYRDLNEYGNRIAHFFSKNGLGSGGIIAVCFDKCPEAYFTILGILKAGCAFVALDPTAPRSRQEFILKDSGAIALAISRGRLSDLDFDSPTPVFEIDLEKLEHFPKTAFSSAQASSQDTCYCLYTSGTTGIPKGCLITHENTVQAMLAFQRLFEGHWNHDSRWLQFASFHFDVSVLEQYWSWSVGITLISASRDLILSDLITTISKLEITHIDLTPSLARLVHPQDVPCLCKGVFITGGEQLRQDILDVWGDAGVIYNAYGPTEATIGVTMYCRVPRNGRSSNIGKQFPNVGSVVLRPGTDVPVLKGAIGELCVSGKLVGKGYLNRERLTNERFPTLDTLGERVYRTGDLVRILHDGCFDFLGRADDQVKLRGQRLEIGEIDHAIKSNVKEVTDVATLVTKHGVRDRDVLISFVVTDTSKDHRSERTISYDSTHLRICLEAQDACRARLPGYMVPAYVLCVQSIPLSANNKAQLSILKSLFNELSLEDLRRLSSVSANGTTKLETFDPKIAEVLAEMVDVDVDNISSSSTVFELGIDSISVIELTRRLRAAGFSGASPSIILQQPRIGTLARLLQDKSNNTHTPETMKIKQSIFSCHQRYLGVACRVLGIPQTDVEYIAPCTPLQEGMLSRAAVSDDQSTYFNTFEIHLNPGTSIEILRNSWSNIISQYAILRTAFVPTSHGYVQVAIKYSNCNWNDAQLSQAGTSAYLERRHQDWVTSNKGVIRSPIEIDCIEQDGRHIFGMRIFHGNYDARSFDLLLRQLAANYHGNQIHKSLAFFDVLPYGPLCDFSHTRSFWEDLFAGFEFQAIPSTISGVASPDVVASRVFDLSRVETKRIALGATHQTIIQAAWLTTLRQQFDFRTWPSFGVVVSGRSLLTDGIETVIGPLFNTLPFCMKTLAPNDWPTLIREVQHYNSIVLSYPHVPLRQIQKWCSNGQPLFDTLFTFDREDVPTDGRSSGLWTEVKGEAKADYPLAFEAIITKDKQLRVTLVARAHSANGLLLNGLLDGFQHSISSIADGDVLPTKGHQVAAAKTNGKINSKSVTQSLLSSSEHSTSEFTWTKQASRIQDEIASLAGVPLDEVGQDTSLFELGLDSIDVIRLAARLRLLGLSITTGGLMKAPTIQRLLLAARTNDQSDDDFTHPPRQLEDESNRLRDHVNNAGYDISQLEAILPPTPLQESMFAQMIQSDFQHYFNHDVLEISPGTDLDKLCLAIQTVIEASPVLKTSFVEISSSDINYTYCQVVAKSIHPVLPKVTLSSVENVGMVVSAAIERVRKSRGRTGLIQVTPLQSQNGEYITLSLSHALYDGASLDLFYKDVEAAYRGSYKPRPSNVALLSRIIRGSSDKAEGFWNDFLLGASSTIIPELQEIGDNGICKLETKSKVSLPDLQTLCKLRNITLQALGQACWAAVLASLTRTFEVTFGVVLSGRTTEEEQTLMFPAMNTVPIRAILHGNTSEFLQYVGGNLSSVNEFQHFPLRQAQKLAGQEGQPLFNTLFTMRMHHRDPGSHENGMWKSIRSLSEVDYPLCLEMEVNGVDLLWTVAGDLQYVTQTTMKEILSELDQVARYFLDQPDGQVVNFDSSSGAVSVCGLKPVTIPDDHRLRPSQSLSKDDMEADRPVSESERLIMDVLAEVSGIERSAVLPTQSIYHLGLDSISAIKSSSMLRKRGIAVSVRDLVKAVSIRDIASKADQTRPNNDRDSISEEESRLVLKDLDIPMLLTRAGMTASQVQEVLPALPVQVHMLSNWQNTGGDLFFYCFEYEIVGRITRSAVTSAWSNLVAEIPILRTHFVATESTAIPFLQIITKPDSAAEQSEANVGELWQIQQQGSPFVCLHIEKASTGAVHMRLKIHHALYDGASLPIMIQRFKDLCHGYAYAGPADLDRSSWHQFAARHYSKRERSLRKEFWTEYLNGIEPFVASKQDACSVSSRIADFRQAASSDITTLKGELSKHGINIQALLFAAYAADMAELKGVQDVVFGIYLANRATLDAKLESLPVPTLSIVPLRVKFSSGQPMLEVAKQIQQDLMVITSFENVSVGLWEIYQWTGVQLDSFVNFLSLPSTAEEDVPGLDRINIREWKSTTTGRLDDSISEMDWLSGSLAQPGDDWLSSNRVRDVYVDGIDIEVALRGGNMDIGVFGPSTRLSQAQASALIDRIVQLLRDI